MKKLVTIVVLIATLMFGTNGASAQDDNYSGPTVTEGVYDVPADVQSGSIITLTIDGLQPLADVEIRLFDSNDVEQDALVEVQGVVVVRADADGNLVTDLRLPDGLDAGTYTIVATSTAADGDPFRSSVVIQVEAETTTGAVTGSDTEATTLALTGNEPRNRALGGVLLVALGLGLVFVAAQRRTESA